MIDDIKQILEKHNFWLYDMSYAIDIGKNGSSKYFRIFQNKVYNYNTSNGIIPSDVYLAISMANNVLKCRSITKIHQLNEDWFKSEEAIERGKKIKENSDKIRDCFANSMKISPELLKMEITI